MKHSLHLPQLEKSPHLNEDPSQPKINKIKLKNYKEITSVFFSEQNSLKSEIIIERKLKNSQIHGN